MKNIMLLAPMPLCRQLNIALEKDFHLLPCSNPAEARLGLEAEPDALILSLSLPGMDALAFLRENADRLPSAVIVLTCYVNRSLLYEPGISAVIPLPCSMEHLRQVLEEQLTKKCPSR